MKERLYFIGSRILLVAVMLLCFGHIAECGDKPDPKLEFLLWGTTAFDIVSTELAINNGAYEANPNPLMRNNKTRIPFIIGTTAITHLIYRKTGNKWVVLIPSMVHFGAGSWNMQYVVRW